MSAASLAGVILAAILAGASLAHLLHIATSGRGQQRTEDTDDGLRRAWCPMCERHTLLVHETKLVAERRDEHHDDDIGCRIIDGHHYAIRIAGTALVCANCGFPHETSEATR